MSEQSLHNLSPSTSRKTKKRVGRGGKRGTYSGRGLKGQRSRSGGKAGLKRLGLKPLISQTHKLRGFKSLANKPETVTLTVLQKYFDDGQVVTPLSLKKKGLISSTKHGVKILGSGSLSKKLTVKNCTLSKKAAEVLK